MGEIEPMKKGECRVVFESRSDRFPSVILVSLNPDYGGSEVLVEYSCDYEEPTFLRWSESLEHYQDWIGNKECSLCRSEGDCRVVETCEFDENPFEAEGDVIFRDCGVTFVCQACIDKSRDVFDMAAEDNESEFVAFNI